MTNLPDSMSVVSSDASKDDHEDGDCKYSVATSLSSITDGRVPRNRPRNRAMAEVRAHRFVAERPLNALDDDDDDEVKSYQDTESRLSRPAADVMPTGNLAPAKNAVFFRPA